MGKIGWCEPMPAGRWDRRVTTTEGGVRRMNPSCEEEGLDRFLNFASAREG